jgi:hypothetical protein
VGLEPEVRPRQDDGRHDRDLEEEAAVIKQFETKNGEASASPFFVFLRHKHLSTLCSPT